MERPRTPADNNPDQSGHPSGNSTAPNGTQPVTRVPLRHRGGPSRPQEGFVRLPAGLPHHPLWADLTDSEARAAIETLCWAKTTPIEGRWENEAHFRHVMGRSARHLGRLLRVGWLEQAPHLCRSCSEEFEGVPDGGIVLHGWNDDQGPDDPTRVDRQARYRERNREELAQKERARRHVDRGDEDAVSPQSHGDAPERDVDRDEDEHREEDREDHARERPDIASLLARGWSRVTARQVRVLDEIADRHDLSGHEWAAGVVRLTPRGEDPLRRVLEADATWKRTRAATVGADQADSQKITQRTLAGSVSPAVRRLSSVMAMSASDRRAELAADFRDVLLDPPTPRVPSDRLIDPTSVAA
jgi:hypothetical protein